MLTAEELTFLEDDLKAFLIVNQLDGDTWEKLNEESPEKAEETIAIFSDAVLQIVYEKVQFLEFRSPDACLVFACEGDKMKVISLNLKPDCKGDLSTPEAIHELLVKQPELLTWFQSEKKYFLPRELEIHQMIEQGCVNSSVEFWEALERLF